MTVQRSDDARMDPVTDPGTPIADDLADGPSAARFRPDPQAMLPAVLGDLVATTPTGLAAVPPVDEPEDETFSAQLARARSRPRGTPERSEGVITAECLAWLNDQPRTKARKVHQSAMTGGGEPDIDAVSHGRAVKIEMKRVGEVPTGRQLRRMAEWQRAGALVGWACSLADVQALLAKTWDMQWQNPLTGSGVPVATPPG